MIDAYASEPQYLAHLLPVWDALEPEERGTLWVSRIVASRAPAHRTARSDVRVGRPSSSGEVILVASYQDSRSCRHRPRVYLEHGAGQTYRGDPKAAEHGSYSGGRDHEGTVLFLCPNEAVASRWRATYDNVAVEVVGSPIVESRGDLAKQQGQRPVVAVSFHWDCRLCPESRWALPHFKAALPHLAERFDVIGHGHPRYHRFFERLWRELDIEHVTDFDEVARRADVYVCDNSSTMYEFAALDRPVVALNAPWYRRDVEHGLRFWNLVPGLQCDEPSDLAGVVRDALADPLRARESRRRAAAETYTQPLEGAASCSAAAIREVLTTITPTRSRRVADPFAPKRRALVGVPQGPPLSEVPTGTVDDVMRWVGSDSLRARTALRLERSRQPKPRTTLVRALEDIVGAA